MAKKTRLGKGKKAPKSASKQRSAKSKPTNGKTDRHASLRGGHFPIVGVGASAGGLEAFTELLRALPDNPEMAFVFIQHMAPTHESMLPRLLSKATAMPVVEVTDGMKVQANHVYVIPPNAGMTITGGVLQLMARKEGAGKILPIDDFFWALAEDQKSAAIGVILSGTASDGTQGLKAIKAEGGITFAQDKRSARFADMPISAVASGCVDFTLSPEGIAEELTRMVRHPYIRALQEPESPQLAEGPDESLRRICLLLRTATGVDFHLYKPATIGRRVARRMAVQKMATREEYYQLLRANRAEVDALYEDIFIHVTGFFRDVEPLLAMRGTLVSNALDTQQGDQAIRVWVPGCSSGEEVYSIAMLLIEELGTRASQTRIQIFGTDISERAIEHARTGMYPEASMGSVSADRRRRFFVRVESGYQISKFVRDICVFARHDVTKDPPFSKLDLISCRNVLIYLGPVLQKRVAETFHYALKPSGFLLLGKSESLSAHANLFAVEDPRLKVFTRKANAAPVYLSTAVSEYVKAERTGGQGSPQAPYDVRREAERMLLDQFVPASLVIDPDLQIVHFQGNTSRYLAPATGQPSFHVLRMVRPELVVDLRTAIHEAKKNNGPIRRTGIRLKHNGTLRSVDLQVTPLKGRHAKESDFLVVFQETPETVPIEKGAKAPEGKAKGRDSKQIEQLRRELATAHSQLKTIIEEHEATSEEMTAVNEEIISSNEELQSTNEELETAKEELQSSNEELITLNDELQNRNAELGQLANDLSNLLVGVEIPIVILSNDLKIRRFTPVAEKALNLIASDVGRPFTDLAIPLDVTDWKELMADVVENRRIVDRDVQDRQGRWHSLRVRPYQTGEHPVDGILMALFDIDISRRSLDDARAARDLAESVVESVHEPLVIIDSELRVVKATHTFYEAFQGNPSETEGRSFFSLSSGVWDVPGLRRRIEEILTSGRPVEEFDLTAEFPGLGYRQMFVNARRVHRQAGLPALILLSIQDTTERHQAEEVVRQREQVLQQNTAQAIVSVGADGRITMADSRASEMFGYTPDEILGSPLEALVPERLREEQARRRSEYLANAMARPIGDGFELHGRRKDGTEFPITVTFAQMQGQDGPVLINLITDLSERVEAQHEHRISQDRLAMAQQGAGIGIWDWDTHSDRAACSRGWGPLHGLAPDDQTCSHDQWVSLIHPEDRKRVQDELAQALDGRKPYNTEMRVVWPDGSVHWLLSRGSVLRGPDRKPTRMVGVSVDITNRKRAEEERDALTARLGIAQDEERRRISRELHDDLTQRLGGLAMELGRLTADFPAASERLKKRVRSLQNRVVEAAETSRHVAYSLHPSELEDLGLAAALRAYCEDFAREGVAVEFSSRNLPESQSQEIASCLYKISQEGLRNVVKHAKTRHAWVTLEGKDGRIVLEVRDAGAGFPVQSLGATGGLGIVSMRERARAVKGSFSIESKPGQGTKVTVAVPL